MSFIYANQVTQSFDVYDEDGHVSEKKQILHGVDMTIEQGNFIVILGHNGSGKSTFARHLNALLTPESGELIIDGKHANEIENILKIRQTCGMVFQNPDNQIVGMTVEEDVAFGPENLGVPTEEIGVRVDESIAKVGLQLFRKKSPNHLSGGQKQRVAIASSLAMRSKCIILDEPTAMLDPKGREEVVNAMIELNKKFGISIILITHHMEEAIHADKIFVMNEGKVCMNGTPKEIFRQVEKLEKLKLDVPFATKLAHLLSVEMPELREIFKDNVIMTTQELADVFCKVVMQ